jgi:hypothetical protein
MNTRQQGDLGERAAVIWLLGMGANVAYPFGHSPDWDLVAEMGGRLLRVQVKTSTCFRLSRWSVTLVTRGGNQSWSGLVKRVDPTRCDYLFVLVGDARQWFILPHDSVADRVSRSADRSTPSSRWSAERL